MKSCPIGPKLMSVAQIRRYEAEAARRGVSKVARGPRGFLTAYKDGYLDPWWCRRRAAFIKRHMAQARKRREQLWKGGKPSRRALALIMWGYKPPR